MAKAIPIPIPINGRGDGILARVNPFLILVGMGFATLFTWYFTGGGRGGGGDDRRATNTPEFTLGDEVGGQTITGIRTQWEYQLDDQGDWWPEERL